MKNLANITPMLPNHINFAITYKCNAKCKHCSINADDLGNERKCYEMNNDQLYKTLQQIADMKIHFLGLTGGEALLHPEIFNIIKFCKDNGILVSIATNGLILNEELVHKLVESNIDGVLISIDHTNQKKHDEIRQTEGLFQKAIESIKLCVKNNIFTCIGVTPMKSNYENIFDIVDLAIKLNANAVNLSSFVPTGRGIKEEDLTNEQWKDLTIKWYKKSKELKDIIRLQIHDPRLYVIDKELPHYLGGISGCLAGYSHCYILPDGTVTPCVMLPISIGNVNEKSLKDIIYNYQTGENYFDRKLLKGKCGECENKYICGGCRAVAYAYTNDAYEADCRCWIK